MKTALVLLFVGLQLALASDLRAVPTWNASSDEGYRLQGNYDRIVPRIDLSPLGVNRDIVAASDKEARKPIVSIDLNEDVKLKDEDQLYPTPRPRVQEIDVKVGPNAQVLVPRPRVEEEEISEEALPADKNVKIPVEDDSIPVREKPNIIRDDPKPLPLAHRFNSDEKFKVEDSRKLVYPPESILVIQEDDDSSEEKGTDQEKEISDTEIQRYIDEIDRQYKGKLVLRRPEVSENVVVYPSSDLRKYIVKDDPKFDRFRREAVKPQTPPKEVYSAKDKDVPSIDGGRISNERKTSGGLSYDVNFEAAKATKPKLGSRTKREDAQRIVISDTSDLEELPKVFSEKTNFLDSEPLSKEDDSADSSEELTRPDKHLLQKLNRDDQKEGEDNQKTFMEVLHKSMKGKDAKESDIFQQGVNRLPHRGPFIKNPNPFLAIDPPASIDSNETKDEKVGVVAVGTDVEGQNKSQNVFIENADFNLITPEDLNEKEESFWHNGFTIGVHISPLALCLGTSLVLLILLMRLALKIYKKKLSASLIHADNSNNRGPKKSSEFDNVSLDTVTIKA